MKTASTLMIYLLWICVIMSGCQREVLIEEPPSSFATMRIQIDWSKAKIQPKGATILFYPVDDGKGKKEQLLTNQVTDDVMKVKEGVYDVIVFNQAPGDFSTFDIEGLDKKSTLAIRMKPIQADWYTPESSEKLIDEPEAFAVAHLKEVAITRQMVTESYQEGKEFPLSFTPELIVHKTTLSIKVKGIKNIKEARGALTGMADSYRIAQNQAGTTKSTQLFLLDRVTKDKDNPQNGSISGSFYMLGFPTEETKAQSIPLELKIAFFLVDNKTVLRHTYKVTQEMLLPKPSTPGGSEGEGGNDDDDGNDDVSLELGGGSTGNPDDPDDGPIELPDVEPEGGGSSSGGGGFDADIDDWEDGEETEFPV